MHPDPLALVQIELERAAKERSRRRRIAAICHQRGQADQRFTVARIELAEPRQIALGFAATSEGGERRGAPQQRVCGVGVLYQHLVVTRERAGEILSLAAPRVEAPTFEELRAYVRRSQPVSTVSVRLYRVGWAASVVLALGTGWLLRGQPTGPALAPVGAAPVASESAAARAA